MDVHKVDWGVSVSTDKWQDGKSYNPWYAYGQATTAKILLAYAMSKKPGIAAFSVHPGCMLFLSISCF